MSIISIIRLTYSKQSYLSIYSIEITMKAAFHCVKFCFGLNVVFHWGGGGGGEFLIVSTSSGREKYSKAQKNVVPRGKSFLVENRPGILWRKRAVKGKRKCGSALKILPSGNQTECKHEELVVDVSLQIIFSLLVHRKWDIHTRADTHIFLIADQIFVHKKCS